MDQVRPCVVEVPTRIYQLSEELSWPGRVYPREVFERAAREGVPARRAFMDWRREQEEVVVESFSHTSQVLEACGARPDPLMPRGASRRYVLSRDGDVNELLVQTHSDGVSWMMTLRRPANDRVPRVTCRGQLSGRLAADLHTAIAAWREGKLTWH